MNWDEEVLLNMLNTIEVADTEQVEAIRQEAAGWVPTEDMWLNDKPGQEKEEWTQ